ncbi:MAG: TetR/AcrR family transcriptional regulator [Anaerolineae bacterium]|nr:TetR/AcrR family transcriptional regulator [Anaerolineae bacterium]
MPERKTDPIQELLIRARRDQILDAATAVFADKGFQRATIHDIAQAAGVADGTIYNYFENKPALLLGIMNRLNETERREGDLAQGTQIDLRAFFEAYFRQRLGFLALDHLKAFQIVLSEVLVNPELRALYMQQVVEPTFAMAEIQFNRLVEAGRIRQVNVPLTMRVMAATFLGLLFLRVLDDSSLNAQWDDLPDLLTMLFLDGLV